jgi:pyridoxal phosphate enzyme (YggS family)
MTCIDERLEEIQQRIAAAAARSGRSPGEVRLIAVSKTQPIPAIQALVELGIRDFGESRIQEARAKIEHFRNAGLNWHFIGHLQSNKTRHIPGNFGWVHAVDSVKLARRISQATVTGNQPVKLLLQVNVAEDPSKHGLLPADLYPAVESLLQQQLQGTEICGLMTIGFRNTGETETRTSFAALRNLLAGCRQRFGHSFRELSMGMSSDFELAIEEGATMVRVGTALFGRRET